MKKYFILIIGCAIIFGCGSGDDKKNDSASTDEKKDSAAAVADQNLYETGMLLIANSDCTSTCHAIEKKLIGPSYIEIANKYEATPANIDTLCDKIIRGGTGIWGTIPMTPHPTLPLDSAREMVKYILSLRNAQ